MAKATRDKTATGKGAPGAAKGKPAGAKAAGAAPRATDDDPLVDHPTWFGQVRDFFTGADVGHMQAKGIDLGTYQGVVANAADIYGQTEAGSMPPAWSGAPRWSKNRIQTFLNWIVDKYPLGTPIAPTRAAVGLVAVTEAAPRMRKELTVLDATEVATLKTAFNGIIARDPSLPDSYFAIAGVHWYPAIDRDQTFHCLHHEDRFLAWHRMHLAQLEDALRSVPGCAEVTLPYWDITTPLPAVLGEAPFATYSANAQVGHGYDPLVTERNTADEITQEMDKAKIPQAIPEALRQSHWEDFNRLFWAVHDNGHNSCGPTMGNQDIAAFDPVFWFFHCNLDRIWLDWQTSVGARTLDGFKSTCRDSTVWIDNPVLNGLPPFDATAADAITFSEVGYAAPRTEHVAMAFENKTGNVPAARSFRIDADAPLSIRVKDINRSGIPGTFVVHLLADGEEVARQAFFQPTEPGICPSCKEKALVSIDFRVPSTAIVGKTLSVEIHVPRQKAMGVGFPLSKVGTPTINVRHLIEGD